MSRSMRSRRAFAEDHQDWLALVGISGPFLALPVLTRVWPALEAVGPEWWHKMRAARANGLDKWVEFLLQDLCGWGDQLRIDGLGHLHIEVPEQGVSAEPDFVLVEPDTGIPQLLGITLKPGQHPGGRPKGDPSPMTPVDC